MDYTTDSCKSEMYTEENIRYQQELDKKREIKNLKKQVARSCSSAGFQTFFSNILFTFISIVLMFVYLICAGDVVLPESMDAFQDNIQYGMISIGGFGIVGLVFLLINKVKLSDALIFDKVKPLLFVTVILAGFSVAICTNLLINEYITVMENVGIQINIDIETPDSTSIPEILVLFLSTAIVPALAEEFAFRGVMLSNLRKYGDGFAVFITSFFFALMHGNFIQIPFAFVGGLVFGFAAVYTNSLLPAILIHAFNNGFSVLTEILYTEGNIFGISEQQADIFLYFLMGICTLASIILIGVYTKKNKGFPKLKKYEGNLPLRERSKAAFLNPGTIISTVYLILYSVFTHWSLNAL